MLAELALQAVKALAYYCALIIIVRMAGKRLAGQTTTFDLLVLITLGVVIQTTALQDGWPNAVVFVVTVFAAHLALAALCARSSAIRHLVRGKPRELVRNGQINDQALQQENMSRDELLAGLRKLGYDSIDDVRTAVLEETGHVSVVAKGSGKRGGE